MAPFLRESGIIHNPTDHRALLLQGSEHVITNCPQYFLVTPGSIRDHVMQ